MSEEKIREINEKLLTLKIKQNNFNAKFNAKLDKLYAKYRVKQDKFLDKRGELLIKRDLLKEGN